MIEALEQLELFHTAEVYVTYEDIEDIVTSLGSAVELIVEVLKDIDTRIEHLEGTLML